MTIIKEAFPKEEFAEASAKTILLEIESNLQKQAFCSIVLAGGNTPKNVYTQMVEYHSQFKIDWKRVYWFWGDERYVPMDDGDNNGLMAKKFLLDRLPVDENLICRFNTSMSPEAAVNDALNQIFEYFRNSTKHSFDIVLLGLGDDGHTLSLFPYSSALRHLDAEMIYAYIDEAKGTRLSMTPRLVNNAGKIYFLVTGSNKSAAFHGVFDPSKSTSEIPAKLISGSVHWLLDEEVIH